MNKEDRDLLSGIKESTVTEIPAQPARPAQNRAPGQAAGGPARAQGQSPVAQNVQASQGARSGMQGAQIPQGARSGMQNMQTPQGARPVAPNNGVSGQARGGGQPQPNMGQRMPGQTSGRPGKPGPRGPQSGNGAPRQGRSDARYTMSPTEIETLATAAEDAVADGRYGAALDSVFFTAGEAREALREKLNIRIPISSEETDLPVIAAAALIESYLEYENINGADIEEKLKLIIESSEDASKNRPTADQVELRVFECALILCVQAEQSGRHGEIKNRLYGSADSFLCKFLERHINDVMRRHRGELRRFYDSVRLQSRVVSEILERYMAGTKFADPFPVRFFARSTPVLITAIVAGILCLISVILYITGYGGFMSFVATDNFLMMLVIVLEILFCAGMCGVSWLVYMSGNEK